MKYILGLGNPKEEYIGTRHNIGRDLLTEFAKKNNFSEFIYDKKINAQISEGKIGREKVTAILPDTYMNKSGAALKKLITSTKKARDLIVLQDDLDMALGKLKIVFDRNSGGHRGVESIRKAIKTTAFIRFKIGISPATPKGIVKKPVGEKKVIDYVLGKFSKKDIESIKKIRKQVFGALETAVCEDYLVAMNKFN